MRMQGEYIRLYQLNKLCMYCPVSGLYWCPLAMTDAAASTITTHSIPLPGPLASLTSRDPAQFWTSGQWMTEKKGGSDVGNGTESVAIHQGGDHYKLYGYKWFSSATDSDMSMALARVVDNTGEKKEGLSMFFLETRKSDGSLNNIEVVKLKKKLGTRQLPTAELLQDGVDAVLVSEPGRGIASISSMLTISRLHNITASMGLMRKITSLARDYANGRAAFSQNDALTFRQRTPIAKFFTAKSVVATISEGLEYFGRQGYKKIQDYQGPGLSGNI